MKSMKKLLAALLAMLMMTGVALADKEDDYDAAMALYKAEEFEQAMIAFEALGRYEDSQQMYANSRWYWNSTRYKAAVALYKEGQYAEAMPRFEELDGFKESRDYVRKCQQGINEQTFQQGKDLYAEGKLEDALAIFTGLGKFGKSQEMVETINAELAAIAQAKLEQELYEQALALKAEGKLEEARDMFVQAGGVEGATEQIYEILDVLSKDEVYERALQDLGYGKLDDALVRFETLGDHLDSAQKAEEIRETIRAARYEEAANAEEPSRAYIIYLALGDYQDSAAKAEALKEETGISALFNTAKQFRREDRYTEAAIAFSLCENYQDSDDLAEKMAETAQNAALFERAHILTDLWRLEEANAIYKALDDYSYASRMGIERISAKQLRDDATTPFSEVFTAPDGSKHVYRMFKGVPRWVEAEAFCRALGGHMATLTTEEENMFVHTFMWSTEHTTAYFGLEDEERDRTWEWVTGEPVEYTNWDPGEPSYSGRERYGMYFYKHKTGTWNDAHFYEHTEVDPGCSFICEWDLD